MREEGNASLQDCLEMQPKNPLLQSPGVGLN